MLEAEVDPPTNGHFESPPALRASRLLAPQLLSGPHHRVAEQVRTDGFLHLYTISSDFGEFQGEGDDLLQVRVREIEALAALREASASPEFAAAAERGQQSPFVATWNLIAAPSDSIAGVPLEAWHIAKRVSELDPPDRNEFEASALREFLGFEARKRALALELGVDLYSSNGVLQRELNRVAWVSFAGSLPALDLPELGNSPPPFEPGDAEAAERVRELLQSESPEDLRRINRIELAVMAIPDPLSEAFLDHPWYSPRRVTIVVASLSALGPVGGRDLFLRAALGADSEFGALFYQRVAQMLRAYAEHVEPIERIVLVADHIGAYTSDGVLVVPAPIDQGWWTPAAADLVETLARAIAQDPPPGGTRLLVAGTLSARARREIEARGIAVSERAAEPIRGGAGS
jgi:hypothetical protein